MMQQVIKALHVSKDRTYWDNFVDYSTEISHKVKNYNPSVKILQQTIKAPMQQGSKELILKKINFTLDGDDYFYFSSIDDEIINNCDENIIP